MGSATNCVSKYYQSLSEVGLKSLEQGNILGASADVIVYNAVNIHSDAKVGIYANIFTKETFFVFLGI